MDSLCKTRHDLVECSLTLNQPCLNLSRHIHPWIGIPGMSNKVCALRASLAKRHIQSYLPCRAWTLCAISSQSEGHRSLLFLAEASVLPLFYFPLLPLFHLQPSCPTLISYRCIPSLLLLPLPPLHSPITHAKAPFPSSWTGKGVGSPK